jgi:hypothetical protein
MKSTVGKTIEMGQLTQAVHANYSLNEKAGIGLPLSGLN